MEAVSVFLQIGSLRMRNKRVFLMAPLHHHYEKQGWKETQVVIRFWIITIFPGCVGINDLKITLSHDSKEAGECQLFFWRK